LYDDPRPTFESGVASERARSTEGKQPDLAALLAKGQTWTVSGTAPDPV
ncbi:MAG TPA: 2-oxoacid:ferredoxin oxidoreductase subunit beta, partial [Croceibacterium sp.]|nr:2-oxoacid:ferredoxin oxidoreductase subunit beta [Croceibacterium sp.]